MTMAHQQQPQQPPAPTLQDIEQKYSQLPPQYRQALLEKQQREHQQQLLQQRQQGQGQTQAQGSSITAQPSHQQKGGQQQQQQQPSQTRSPQQQQQQLSPQQQQLQQQQYRQASRAQPNRQQSQSLASSPSGRASPAAATSSTTSKLASDIGGAWSSTRQRIASAPLAGSSTTSSIYRLDRDNDSLRSNTSSITRPGRAHWKPDSSTNVCTWPGCRVEFGLFDRRHHCRKCGDIFCSTHCSKEVPLDHTLDFSPAEGVMSRACVGCYEAFEQWQGLIPASRNHYNTSQNTLTSGSSAVSGDSLTSETASLAAVNSATHKPNTGHIPDGFLGGQSTKEAIGREDIVRQPPGTIAIKRQPSVDQTVMPMPSVPHDWSWSTF